MFQTPDPVIKKDVPIVQPANSLPQEIYDERAPVKNPTIKTEPSEKKTQATPELEVKEQQEKTQTSPSPKPNDQETSSFSLMKKVEKGIVYNEANLENFSQLYWGLGRLDLKNDKHIDNFLLLNECDIYKDYIYNEFEWLRIREYAREHVKERIANRDFPVRFEFVQELQLNNYDFDKQGFMVSPSFAIDGIRRFEIFATDIKQKICGYSSDNEIPGYPKGVLLELNRPVQFDVLPMDTETADKYLAEKTIEFKRLPLEKRKQSNLFNFRNIFLVVNVQFFANGGDHFSEKEGTHFAKALAILESIEIYDDVDRTKLLYKQNYKRSSSKKRKAK
ncbi:DUF4852 domain-containing protein [Alphaproteobacteria bacterium]|nr:DUF4852 domain-containing protein [Alphaproteobacteria bacterium]